MIISKTKNAEPDHITQRLERLVSLGKPTCDVCYSLSPEDRPEEGDFWPDRPVHYIREFADSLYQWKHTTVCNYHDTPENRPADATHRVIDEPEYVGDRPDQKNGDYFHKVQSVEILEG